MARPATVRPAAAPWQLAGPGDVPVYLTRFVGRARELDEVSGLLAETRLLTLTGAGGSGKTRLAGELVARLRAGAAPPRTVWVDLAALDDPALVVRQVAAALGLPPHPGMEPVESVREALGVAPTLLVLDNCEHLIDECAALADSLLRVCPALAVLATSRGALGVAGETAWLVPPLADDEAPQLFLERARAVAPGMAADAERVAVGEICRRLDGIPLAIELAAARARALTPSQIATRLDDAFRLLIGGSRTSLPRHRTLRGAMEWSHALLGDAERVLFRRLAVFAGGFTLEAAEAVCAGDPLSADEVLDGVAALVDKSLVTVSPARGDAGEPRYRLLETVRQYAHERLTEAGELAAYRERHARHFLDRAEALAPLFLGGWGAGGAVARLGADRDNLRIATGWVLHEAPDGRMALRFADALFWFWYGAGDWLGRGQFAEGHAYMEAALARDDEGDPLLRARVLLAAGMTAHPQGAYEHALARVDEAHAVFAAHGDLVHAAMTLGFAAACHLMLGAVDRAWTMIQEADAMVRPLPPGVVHGFPGVWYVWTALVRGDIASAERRGAELLHMGESLGHPTMIGHQSMLLGRTALATGDLDAAAVHLVRAFRSHEEIGDGWGIGLDLEPLAALAHARGRHEDAVRLDGAGDAHRARIAVTLYATDLPARRQREHDLRARLGAEFDRLHAEGGALTRDQFADLVAAATSSPDAPAPQASDERPLLEVRTLGALEVVLDGRPVEAAAWGSARTRELLVLLLAHPDGLTKEQVGVALWPEASTTQLRNNFHVTLHRLRRALGGAERVVLQGERYRIDGPVAFDARRFEEEVVAGQRALSRGDADGAAALERALAPYRAPFLDGEPVGDWHVPVRDRLQRLHTRGLAALGAHLAAAGRLREAAATYERLLAHDPLDEEATRGLMHALARLGDRPAALRAYERMRAALRAELEVSPRPETVALAATLRRTNDD